MRALGKVKYIHEELYELVEIKTGQDWKLRQFCIDFIDQPSGIVPEVGDIFLNWYWVPVFVIIDYVETLKAEFDEIISDL